MFDFYNEIVSGYFSEYVNLLKVCPVWLIWVYFGLMFLAVIYSIFFSRTLSRVLWIVFSITLPFIAFPLEIIQHIITNKLSGKYFSNRMNSRGNYRVNVRLRFFIIPAAGALIFALMHIEYEAILPYDIKQYFGMMAYRVPWVLTGAFVFLLGLFIVSYRISRSNIRYLDISVKNANVTSPTGEVMYGHKIYNAFGADIPTKTIDEIIRDYYAGIYSTKHLTDGLTFEVDNIRYDVRVLDSRRYNLINDVESVVPFTSSYGYDVDKVTYIDWEVDKDGKFKSDSNGYRKVLWRSSPKLFPLIIEALTSFSLIWAVLSPSAIAIHIEILKAVIGLFGN